MYYQTTPLNKAQKVLFMKKAKGQDDFILKLFQNDEYQTLTASKILDIAEWYGRKWPITSIRRSLNTLSNDLYDKQGLLIRKRLLIKLESTSLSIWARPEHRYKLV